MKTQPNTETLSGPESSSKPEVGSTQVRFRWLLVPLVSLCNSGGKKSPASPLCSPPTGSVHGSLGKKRWPLHALRGVWVPCPLPQPEKLPPPVLGSGASTSDKTVAVAPLSHACEVEMGQRLDAKAQSGLACVNTFGPGLGKAHAASLGNPFKPTIPASSSDLGQGSPKCSSCLRKGTPAGTPQMEASPPVTELSPLVEAHNPQGKLSSPPISSRGKSSSSSTPFWDTGFERERGSSLVWWNRRQRRWKRCRIPCP